MRVVKQNFPGAKFPPGTKVRFRAKEGMRLEGIVEGLLTYQARVVVNSKLVYKVPYYGLTALSKVPKPAMTLDEITEKAEEFLHKHNLQDWQFAFSLTSSIGGQCWHRRKFITISVTYCQKATKAEIINTLLHEIAHAIAGYENKHNHVWQRVARSIGCNAKRCHSVNHTPAKWSGKCKCRSDWKRQRLTKLARTGICPRCSSTITWTRAAEVLSQSQS